MSQGWEKEQVEKKSLKGAKLRPLQSPRCPRQRGPFRAHTLAFDWMRGESPPGLQPLTQRPRLPPSPQAAERRK